MTKRQMTRISALKDEAYAHGDNETAALCAEALDGNQAAISKLTVMLLDRTSEPSKIVGRAWGKRQSIPTHSWAKDSSRESIDEAAIVGIHEMIGHDR